MAIRQGEITARRRARTGFARWTTSWGRATVGAGGVLIQLQSLSPSGNESQERNPTYGFTASAGTAGLICITEGIRAASSALRNAERSEPLGLGHTACFYPMVHVSLRFCSILNMLTNEHERGILTIWIEAFAAHVSSTQIIDALRQNPSSTGRSIPIVWSHQGGIGRYVDLAVEVRFLVTIIMVLMVLTSGADQPSREKDD